MVLENLRIICDIPYVHCKDKMPKIWNKYSQKRNIPISTFMCLWANYIFPRWVCLFCWWKYVDRSWEYINRSQTHECGNWGWGRAIPRKGIYKRNCRCSVYISFYFIVRTTHTSIQCRRCRLLIFYTNWDTMPLQIPLTSNPYNLWLFTIIPAIVTKTPASQ